MENYNIELKRYYKIWYVVSGTGELGRIFLILMRKNIMEMYEKLSGGEKASIEKPFSEYSLKYDLQSLYQ